ncbi:hypothetical protein E2I00_011102 [Balaenoptera physalus]|uniref:Eukaryotic translation initiation factor 4E-binding protein 1 n=1 Tax=Balaenoptera physalus TaxID=9770 RepID=A0A643BSI2_BALPH|nr:hypothetical protein E2I00_011102 [Balaenoptera physalus]
MTGSTHSAERSSSVGFLHQFPRKVQQQLSRKGQEKPPPLYRVGGKGTRIIYDRKFLMECRNSPVTKTPPRDLPTIPGVTSPVGGEPPPEAGQDHLSSSPEDKPAGAELESRLLAKTVTAAGIPVPGDSVQEDPAVGTG